MSDFMPSKKVQSDMAALVGFLDSLSLDNVDEGFQPIQAADVANEDNSELKRIEEKFEVQLSETGRSEVLKLIGDFHNNNNAQDVVRAFGKWSDDMPDLFQGLSRRQSASKFRSILEYILTLNMKEEEGVTPVSIDAYDKGVVRYVAGYCLHKAEISKKSKFWKPAITFLTTKNSSNISFNDYFNFINEKYKGRLNLLPSELFTNYFNCIYIDLLQYCKRGLQKCNLLCLFHEIMTSVNYSRFSDQVSENCPMDEEHVSAFVVFVTKLFVRTCFFKFVDKEAQKLKSDQHKAKPLRVALQVNPKAG